MPPPPQHSLACSEIGPRVQEFEQLDCVRGWPVLPTVDGVASLSPLQASVLVWEPDTEEAPPAANSALRKLGIRWGHDAGIFSIPLTHCAAVVLFPTASVSQSTVD